MKIHKKFKHPLSEKIGFWGDRGGVELRINFGKLVSGEEFPKDSLHYHKTRTTYFCVLDGAMFVEVEGKVIQVTKDSMLEVGPGEKYKTVSVGQEGCSWVVVGSHNKDDKVVM